MTVRELIELLKTKFDGDEEVGRLGYFGEFYPMNGYDFQKSESMESIDSPRKPIKCLDIVPPYIGEEPE